MQQAWRGTRTINSGLETTDVEAAGRAVSFPLEDLR